MSTIVRTARFLYVLGAACTACGSNRVDAGNAGASLDAGGAWDVAIDHARSPTDAGIAHTDGAADANAANASNVLTQHNDVARTGSNPKETMLTTASVDVEHFGKLFSRSVDDVVYAQPLVVANVAVPNKGTRNVLYVVTMSDSVYAFDADVPAQNEPLWHASFVDAPKGIVPVDHDDVGQKCKPYVDISGNIGIESTPVIDPAAGTLYLVAKTKEGAVPSYRLHALDVATGNERPGSPVELGGTVWERASNGAATALRFDPSIQNQRAALLLANGNVYVAFASYCDTGDYHGWVLAYDATTLAQTAVFNSTPHGEQGGIWMSGEGPSSDSAGNLVLALGNGDVDVNAGGNDVSEGVVKLTPQLSLSDWFVPFDYTSLDSADLDLGSTGVLLVPGTNLTLTLSKAGRAYVNDLSNLGHYQAGDDSQIVQTFELGGRVQGSPVAWALPGGARIYVGAESDVLRVYQVQNGQLVQGGGPGTIAAEWPGSVLSLSANGSEKGTGIVWSSTPLSTSAWHTVTHGILRAFDADDLTHELWNSQQNAARDDCGNLAKFNAPTVVNGKVYLASFSNQVCVYGLIHSP